ncbi:MFS transporter [Rhodospirillaceae bacterium KN72]|uniref:MFS transporter n=1 Tax=Pacificispira spongiicola TaxID=2729598 RepID=A0A7Y0HEQ6_9PROT|nr:MFS transporter [Pacificispira spongiicola]NMM43823.1 MFS transporter [Pacificispira spongiicola]
MNRKAVVGWCLYDWANSAFPTLISTFVFATYFTRGIAETPEKGAADWGYAMSLAALIIAVAGPVLGAISDRAGRRKPWLLILTLIGGVSTMALWTAEADSSFVFQSLVLVVIGTVCFELGMVFYNAMLPDVAPAHMTGRISGWGWGLGYAGGLAALVVSLVLFVQPDPALFGLSREASEHIRAIPVLAGAWMIVFAVPLFLMVPDRRGSGLTTRQAVREGLSTLWGTLRSLPEHPAVFRFLIARMFYIDGLNTLFAFGGIFAAAVYGMESEEVLLFGISLNVTAGLGAAGFAFLDDKWGPKPVIAIAVGAIGILGLSMLLVDSKDVFWVLGLGLGLFLGPAQAASRSMMARLSPPELTTEFFGLYALSGKATAFMGPALLALAVEATDSQHWGMATVLPFLVVGLLLLKGVRPPKR